MKEFSDLGAGFKIAALDLELRGAGNMLGGEQSGHIEAIGFEMYTSMLEEAVRKIKGEDDKPAHADTSVNLGISVRIDAEYIPEENQRLRMYKRIAGCRRRRLLSQMCARSCRTAMASRRSRSSNLLAAGEIRLTGAAVGHCADRPQAHADGAEQDRRSSSRCCTSSLLSADGEASALNSVDPGVLMKLVSRNTKRGAQFTPQGVLRWPLTSAKAEDVSARDARIAGTTRFEDASKLASVSISGGESLARCRNGSPGPVRLSSTSAIPARTGS